MSAPLSVPVNLAINAYDIHIGEGLIDQLSSGLLGKTLGNHAILFSDQRVADIYLSRVRNQLTSAFDRVSEIVFPEGENSKSVTQLESIWNQMVSMGVDRKATVIALGGGVD